MSKCCWCFKVGARTQDLFGMAHKRCIPKTQKALPEPPAKKTTRPAAKRRARA